MMYKHVASRNEITMRDAIANAVQTWDTYLHSC